MEMFTGIFTHLPPTTVHTDSHAVLLLLASAAQDKPDDHFPRKIVMVTFDTEFAQLLITKSEVLKKLGSQNTFVIPLSHCARGHAIRVSAGLCRNL